MSMHPLRARVDVGLSRVSYYSTKTIFVHEIARGKFSPPFYIWVQGKIVNKEICSLPKSMSYKWKAVLMDYCNVSEQGKYCEIIVFHVNS